MRYFVRSVFLLLPIISAIACSQLPISSDTQFDLFHQAQKSLFKKDEPSRSDDFSYQPLRDKKIQTYVSSIGKKLLQITQIQAVDFHVLATNYVQGFTDFSDVYVTQGMLNTISNEAELASLLAHEIGHIALKHDDTHFKDKGKIWDILSREAESQAGTHFDLDEHRYDVAYANWGKDKEEKADEFGADLAAKAGYNSYALADLFDRLAQNAKDGFFIRISNLKGTHKNLKDRAEHLRTYLNKKNYPNSGNLLTYEYQTTLGSQVNRNQDLAQFSKAEKSVLAEVSSYQKEVDRYQKLKQPLPVKRFQRIMDRTSSIIREYKIEKEVAALTSSNQFTHSFLQERLIQKSPLWKLFRPQLSANISHLLASLGRIGLGFVPMVGSAADLYELLVGKDFLSGEELTTTQRALTAAGLIIGQGRVIRGFGGKILRTAQELGVEQEVKASIDYAEKLVKSIGHNFDSLKKASELLKRNNIPIKGRREVIEAFTQDARVIKNSKDKTVYRYWVEGFNNPKGNWVTEELLQNPHAQLALPRPGPYKVQKWTLPADTEIIEGLAGPNFGQLGGARQIFVPNPEVLR